MPEHAGHKPHPSMSAETIADRPSNLSASLTIQSEVEALRLLPNRESQKLSAIEVKMLRGYIGDVTRFFLKATLLPDFDQALAENPQFVIPGRTTYRFSVNNTQQEGKFSVISVSILGTKDGMRSFNISHYPEAEIIRAGDVAVYDFLNHGSNDDQEMEPAMLLAKAVQEEREHNMIDENGLNFRMIHKPDDMRVDFGLFKSPSGRRVEFKFEVYRGDERICYFSPSGLYDLDKEVIDLPDPQVYQNELQLLRDFDTDQDIEKIFDDLEMPEQPPELPIISKPDVYFINKHWLQVKERAHSVLTK